MDYITPAIEHVAKKLARVPGVEQSFVCRDGAVDAIIEGGYNRDLRSHLLGIGRRAMVPVRVFYRMEDGRALGEGTLRRELGAGVDEDLDDFYTTIKVAGFAGEPKEKTPAEVAGDSYSKPDSLTDKEARDSNGQLKLQRIRAGSRGRPVVGWKYGKHTVRKGSKVEFKKSACLQWTMGRTINVKPGTKAVVHALSSRQPVAYLTMGNQERVELPIHAVGHVYDVMATEHLESSQYGELQIDSSLSPEMRRLVMAVGFGRPPGSLDTKKNTQHFKGPTQPDLIGYAGVDEEDAEEDMIVPPLSKAATKGKPKISVKKGKVVDPDTPGSEKAPVILGKKS